MSWRFGALWFSLASILVDSEVENMGANWAEAAGGDPTCWRGQFHFEACCFPAPYGQSLCWDDTFNAQRCCGSLATESMWSPEHSMSASCWSDGFTCEACCFPIPDGNPDCWGGPFTAQRCCPACFRGQHMRDHVFEVQDCQVSIVTRLDPAVFEVLHNKFTCGLGQARLRLYLFSQLKRLVIDRHVRGAVVELGCWDGQHTSVNIRRLLDAFDPSRDFHVYDSFRGLPDRVNQDGGLTDAELAKGDLAVSLHTFRQSFENEGLRLPDGIHQGFFGEIPDREFPSRIAFAFFDGDLYDSIIDSFKKVYGKVVSGGLIAIHDYMEAGMFPGVKLAVDEFLADKPESVLECYGTLALVIKS